MNQVPPALPKLSPALAGVVKLAQSRVSDEVLLAYIERLREPFTLSAEEIVYLHDIGVSEAVIAVLIKRAQVAPPPVEEAAAPATNSSPAVTEATPPTAGPVQPAIGYEVAPPPQVMADAPPQVTYFYPSLAPYGSWLEVPDYGWCWQPTVAAIDITWRPYCHRGQWLSTDSGWYWQSDYSWGWAPFHYGRWYYQRRCGWVWVPGSIWAPAWVSWRSSPSYCGWAPLPPEAHYGIGGFSYHGFHVGVGFEFGLTHHYYTYLPVNRFCGANPYSHFIWGARVGAIHGQTKVVNNYYVGRNTIVNPGPLTREQAATAARSEVRKVSVLNLPAGGGRGLRPDRLVPAGESMAIYRPSLPAPLFKDLSQTPSRQSQESRKDAAAGGPSAAFKSTGLKSLAPATASSPVAPITRAGQADGTRSLFAPTLSRAEPGKRTGSPTQSTARQSPASGAVAGTPALSPMQPAVRPGVEILKAPQAVTSAPLPPRPGIDALRPPQPIAPMRPSVRPGMERVSAPQPVTSTPTPPRAGIDALRAPQAIAPMQPAIRPGLETPSLSAPSNPQPASSSFNSSYRTYEPRRLYPPQPMSQPAYQRPTHWQEPQRTTPPGPSHRPQSTYSAPQPQTSRPGFFNPSGPTTFRQQTTTLQPRTQFNNPSPSSSVNRPPSYSAPAPQRPSYRAPSPSPSVSRPSYHASPAPQRPAVRAPSPAPTYRSSPPAVSPPSRPAAQAAPGGRREASHQEKRK